MTTLPFHAINTPPPPTTATVANKHHPKLTHQPPPQNTIHYCSQSSLQLPTTTTQHQLPLSQTTTANRNTPPDNFYTFKGRTLAIEKYGICGYKSKCEYRYRDTLYKLFFNIFIIFWITKQVK